MSPVSSNGPQSVLKVSSKCPQSIGGLGLTAVAGVPEPKEVPADLLVRHHPRLQRRGHARAGVGEPHDGRVALGRLKPKPPPPCQGGAVAGKEVREFIRAMAMVRKSRA